MMKFTKDEKKSILEGFLEIFLYLADEEFQQKAWIKYEGTKCYAFDDLCCDFSLQQEDILNRYKTFGITNEQYELLRKFCQEFDEFADNNDWPPEFIDSPEWARIVNMAKEVLVAFNYSRKSE